MRKRKEDQQKFVSDSKSSDHLQHPHYRHSKSTHSTSRDRKNQFETQRVNYPTTDFGTSYTWDGLFTVDEGHKGQLGQKQHFLGRIAKSTRNIRSYQMWILVNSIGIIFTLGALYTCYFHFDFFHYRLCTVYASLGHADAQHIVGERLLHGRGVEKDQLQAMEWFRLAAQQGHPKSSYNLAIGHLSGLKTNLEVGEAQELIKHASDHGLVEAVDVYDNLCKHGRCD